MAGSALDLSDVTSRAGGIRRRRLALTGAVAAVVLAVAVPVGVSVTDTFDAQPIPPADRTQHPDRTDQARPEPDFPREPVRLTADGLPEGEPPGLSYIAYSKGELVTPEATYDLPEQTASVARYGDGWIALGGESEVRWLDADLDVVRSERTTSTSLAVSDDGSRLAWVEGWYTDPTVELKAAPTAGGEPRSWSIEAPDAELRPVGFLGEGRVVFTIMETSTNGIAEPDGSITELEGFLSVRSASESAGLVAVQTEYSNARKCDGVVDPSVSTSETLWETCDYQLGEFSPDGRYVVGKVVQADQSASSVAVLDARTGKVLARFVSQPDDVVAMYEVAWEDEDSLLAVALAVKDMDGLMMRLDLDGSLERTGVTGTFANMGIPFGFATYHRW
jgi:hypothetical protein